MTEAPRPVQVLHRSGQWCAGSQLGSVVRYAVPILSRWQVSGRPTIDHSYLLLDEGVQLTQPGVFTGWLEGAWYVDLVEVDHTTAGLVVRDLYVDLLVPAGGDSYQVLDLDELADAVEAELLSSVTAVRVLRETQQFIDRHLRTPDTDPGAGWLDFPPAAIAGLAALPADRGPLAP